MTAQVFQPGHRLLTMSIEEAGLHEMEMMQKWQERNSKFMEEANSWWHKEGTMPTAEDEVGMIGKMTTVSGAGNKKLTPCGTPKSRESREVASFTSSSVSNSWPHPMAAFFRVLVAVFSAPRRTK